MTEATIDFKGHMSESHKCIDCGFDTAPGNLDRAEAEQAVAASAGVKEWSIPIHYDNRSETYIVHDHVWKAAGMGSYDGCLCIGCLEKRIGRRLIPDDFADHPFNSLPGTPRLMERRRTPYDVLGAFPKELLTA
jgi:hypothetical protein